MLKDFRCLGVDLGGTAIKIALVNECGNIIAKDMFDTNIELGPNKIIENVITHVRQMLQREGFPSIKSIGIGVAGDIDQKFGIVRYSPNLMWNNVKLREALKRKLEYPIIVENDANAAAWGIYIVETAKKVQNLVAITLGTGVGGGIIIDGKLFRGTSGSAGEIGHMTLYPDGPKCKCGNYGCLERYLGAAYIAENIRGKLKKNKNTIILKMVNGNINKITPLIIERAAREGDKLAINIYNELGTNLGIALGSIINLLNPDMIVISGGVSKAGELLRKTMLHEVKERSFKSAQKSVEILFSKNDRDSGVIGAALLE